MSEMDNTEVKWYDSFCFPALLRSFLPASRKQTMRALALFSLVLISCTDGGELRAQPSEAKGIELFEQKIRPVLAEHCYRCHSQAARKNGKLKAELLLDTKAGLVKGGVSGPVLQPRKPDESL